MQAENSGEFTYDSVRIRRVEIAYNVARKALRNLCVKARKRALNIGTQNVFKILTVLSL